MIGRPNITKEKNIIGNRVGIDRRIVVFILVMELFSDILYIANNFSYYYLTLLLQRHYVTQYDNRSTFSITAKSLYLTHHFCNTSAMILYTLMTLCCNLICPYFTAKIQRGQLMVNSITSTIRNCDLWLVHCMGYCFKIRNGCLTYIKTLP